MRVVVTGAAGKLGRACTSQLRRARPEWQVVASDVVVPPGAELLQEGAHAAPDGPTALFRPVDLMDADAVEMLVSDADVVVHLGGIPRPGLHSPNQIFRVNALGTQHVVDGCVRSGVRRLVLASSTAVLGTDWGDRRTPPERVPFDESSPCRPADPYGVSKLCAEEVVRGAARQHGLSALILRPPWILAADEVARLGAAGGIAPEGLHTYAWVDLRDLVRAFEKAIVTKVHGGTFFVGAPDSSLDRPVRDAYALVDGGSGIRGLDNLRDFEAALSSKRAADVLGWTARRSWRRPSDW